MQNVMSYGAVGDGVTDDTAAFIAALAPGGPLYLPCPPVAYVLSAPMNLVAGQSIIGQPGATILHNGSSIMFYLIGSDILITDLIVDGINNTGVGSGLFRLANNVGDINNIEIRNIKTINEQIVAIDVPAGPYKVDNLNIHNITCIAHRGEVLNLQMPKRNLAIHDVMVDFTNSSNPNFAAITLASGLSTLISGIMIHGSNNAAMSSQYGIRILPGGECYTMTNIDIQYCGNRAIWIQEGISFRLSNANLQLNGAATGATAQLWLDDCIFSQVSNVMFRGIVQGASYSNLNCYGVYMNGGGNISFSGCEFKSNGAGVYQSYNAGFTYPTGNLILSGCTYNVNTYYGYIGDAQCPAIIDGATCVYNGNGDFYFQSGLQFVYNAIKSNGTFLTSATGAGIH